MSGEIDHDDGGEINNIIGRIDNIDISRTFKSDTQGPALLVKMNELRESDHDVEIVAAERIIKAHKLVLKSSSDYFSAMFNSGMKETESNRIEVDFEFDLMSALIDFIYTGEMTVTSDNVYGLYQASDFYGIVSARAFCSQFLVNTLDDKNCFELYYAARDYTNNRLQSDIVKFISCHIDIIAKAEGFLRLQSDELLSLLRSEFLIFSSETEMFKAILAWINHDITDRAKFLAALFKTLKLHHMSRSFLIHHVRQHKLINQNEHCKELVMCTYEHLLMPNDDQVKLHETPKRNAPDEAELAYSEPEDIEPGPNVKVFDHLVTLLGLQFTLTPATIQRFNQMQRPNGFRFDLQVYTWCDQSKHWELIIRCPIGGPPQPIEHLLKPIKLPFVKRIMIKHLKIHITHVPQSFFKIAYITPAIARNLTEQPQQQPQQ